MNARNETPYVHRANKDGRFRKLSLPFYGAVALGNGTQYFLSAFRPIRGLCVGVEGRGSYIFSSFVHWTYAMEKLGLLNGDAMNVSDWINDQFGELVEYSETRQGRYNLDLTEEWS